MKYDLVRHFWAHLLHRRKFIAQSDKSGEAIHYTLTNGLLTSYTERDDSQIKFVKRRAALVAWVGMIGAVMVLESAADE